MRWHDLLCLALALVPSSNAIFADDAYQIDYHQALLGVPQPHTTFFHKPQSGSNASLLYTISDKAVLGAINPKDGSVLWRHALAGQPVTQAPHSFLVAGEGDGQITSAFNGTVAAWDALDGKLVWEYKLPRQVVYGLEAVPVLGRSPDRTTQNVVVLAGNADGKGTSSVVMLAGDSGVKIWEHIEDRSYTPVSIAVTTTEVFYVSRSSGALGEKTRVAALDVLTGTESKLFSPSLDSEILTGDVHSTLTSCASFPFLATSEKPYKTIKLNILGTSKVLTLALEDKGELIEGLSIHHPCEIGAASHLLVHVRTNTKQWAEVFHVNLDGQSVSKAYTLPATEESSTFAASSIGSTVYFTRVTETEVVLYSSMSHGVLSRWVCRGSPAPGLFPLHSAAEVVSRGKTGLAVRVAQVVNQGAWALIRNGELQWMRPENLAYARTAVWVDVSSHQSLARELRAEESANPLTAYVRRWKRHTEELMLDFPKYLQSLPESFTQKSLAVSEKPKHNMMLGSKMIVVATSLQEVVAIDATSGIVVWMTTIQSPTGKGNAIVALSVQHGRLWVYFSQGSLAVLNLKDGKLIERKSGSIPMTKMISIPGSPAAAIIKVSADGTPNLPEDDPPSTATEGNSLLTLTPEGVANGWTVGQSMRKTWTIKPPAGAKIVNVVARPAHDPVASVGKVLGDRSVIYKYLSPNLALLTAISSTTLTVYLIEAISGTVLHTSTHANIDPTSPIPSIMSEHWFAYSFTTLEPYPTTTITIFELYESPFPNDRGPLGQFTNYTTFAADAVYKPHVISQSFTIAEPISHMAVTQTTQGITSRQILCTLPNSAAIIGLPLHALNARRPVDRDPTPLEAEEGLFRYQPSLELDPKLYLSHAREVLGISHLTTSPSLLESTSLVIGYGHDFFGTTVSPSMAFDVLDKGFNKVQLLLTIGALGLGVAALAPLVRRSMVEGRWKT